ncbi:MAG: bacterial Ig-like domain-containing protein [Clostridia bacterium]|nr:bacterial Ig-like domain-containing protein [Clostridia bacterium]
MKRKIFISVLLVLTAMLTLASCLDGIANKKVTGIQILSGAPSEVTVGETPDFSNLKAKVTYNDGETKEVGYADVTISAIDTSKAGKVEYTLSYDGGSIKGMITVKSPSADGPGVTKATLSEIKLLSGIKTEFFVGTEFHTTDLKLTAIYSDNSTATITSDMITIIQEIDPDVVGQQTLIVKYEDKTLSILINIKEVLPTGFTLVTTEFDNEILIGDSFDFSKITGKLRYNNSDEENIANADITFGAVDVSSAGQKTLTATYLGFTAEYPLTVLGIKSILFGGFAKTIKPGETPDLSGLTATVTATNNETFNIDAADVDVDWSEFDNTLTTNSQSTTILKLGYCGTVVDCEITVKAEFTDATLLGLELKSTVKANLFVGESFDDSGISFKAVYTYGFFNNGITKDRLNIDGEVNTAEAGTYPITYSFTDKGVTKSYTLNVVVVEPTPTELELNTDGFTNWVIKGENLDTSAITATLKYDYVGKTTALANADLTIEGIDTDNAGNKTLIVSYNGISATVAYTVVTVDFIEVVGGVSSTVSLGDNAYEDNLSVKATLSNGEIVYRGLDTGVTVDDTSFNNEATGTYHIIVSFGNATLTVTVEVIEVLEELVLQEIAIQPGLATSIFAGDDYDYSNLKITAMFNYGITKTYTIAQGVEVTTSGSKDEAGTYTVTAAYTHEGVTKTASLDVTVVAVVATSIKINAGSFATTHYIDNAYSTAGITATVYYNKPGYTTTLTADDLVIAIDTATAGDKTLTATYGALTDTATVQVIGIKSVVFEGVDDRYRVNSEISTAGIIVAITYDDDTTRDVAYNASTMVIPALDALNESLRSETKEYTFTYLGVEYKQNVTVYAELEDATLLSIEYTGATKVFVGGSLSGKLSVKAYYTYGFVVENCTEGVTASALDTSTKGEREITVSYEGKTVNATITVAYPKVVGITIISAPFGIQAEDYDYDNIVVKITVENGADIPQLPLSNLADYEINASIDVTTAGDKLLTLTANGKEYTHPVTVYKISKVVIDTQNFNSIVKLNSTFSTESLENILVYLENMQEPVIREATDFEHNVNTAVKGEYALTTTYLGVKSEVVTITVADQNWMISQVLDPDPIADWKNGIHAGKFLDSGYCYAVGDDNPFKYALKFKMFDTLNEIYDTRGIEYVGKSSVTLNGTVVGDEYVTIDEANHTFDFTEAAIGKTFVITTAHKDHPTRSFSLEVSVVDGYNVHEAVELNLLTNANNELGNSGKYQMDVLYTFLANRQVAGINNMTSDQYKEFVNSINGMILHDKFVLERSDFPEEYFFITAEGDYYIWDHQSIFYRMFTEVKLDNPAEVAITPEVFNLYGNYFTITSNNIPIVAPQGKINKNGVSSNDDDGLSSAELMRFNISGDISWQAKNQNKFYYENYVLNMYAIGFHDNDPSVAVQPELAQQRAKLGILALKFKAGIYNLYAVNAEAYFQTMCTEDFDMVTNINYCTFYNAWNSHLMPWMTNRLDESGEEFDGSFHAGFRPQIININNSFVGKSGGPAIISSCANPDEAYNQHESAQAIINIDDASKVFSYVKGTESWFVSYKAGPTMELIVGMNAGFQANTPSASFVTPIGGANNGFVNFVYLNMDAYFNPGTGANSSSEIDGSLSIGGNVKIDMSDAQTSQQSLAKTYLSTIGQAYGQVPIFFTDNGGASIFNGQTVVTLAELAGGALPGQTDKNAALTGDYVTLFYYNLGVMLGFNEPTLNAEPTPADCTVERVTASHGYGN